MMTIMFKQLRIKCRARVIPSFPAYQVGVEVESRQAYDSFLKSKVKPMSHFLHYLYLNTSFFTAFNTLIIIIKLYFITIFFNNGKIKMYILNNATGFN